MNSELYQEFLIVMEKVQRTSSCYQKCRSVLAKLYKKSDTQTFYNCVERILEIILIQDPKVRNIHVERAIDFCTLFFTSPELKIDPELEEYSLLEKVFYFLLNELEFQLHNLESDTVRYRVCQLINKLLNNLTDTELNDDLCDKIEEAMLLRLQEDSKSEIRFQAVSAVYRLQNPDNKKCQIIPQMILHMSADLSAKVRKICVQKIGIRRDVLVALVVRVRDINADVRLAAFARASKLGHHFKISEKHTIIKQGFLDSCEQIKTFVVTQLVPAWLVDYDNDYLKLLKAVRMDANEYYTVKTTEVIKYILRALFSCRPVEEILKFLPITDNRTLAYKDMNWESVIYWRYLAEKFQKLDNYELHLYTILPDLVDFSKYIRDYYKQKLIGDSANTLEFKFILNQLFTITQGYDVSDTVSRQALNELVADVLREVNVDPNTATTIIKNLEKSIPKVEERITFICEIISDIMYPVSDDQHVLQSTETEFQVSQMKFKLNCLNEELISAVREQNYEVASTCKNEMSELKASLNTLQDSVKASSEVVKKTDAHTMLKCLTVARGLLISPQITIFSPTLRTLCEDVITEQLTLNDQDETVLSRALECYGLCCIIDNKNAEKGIYIFSTYILRSTMDEENCITDHLKTSIKATADLLVLYGPSLLNQLKNNEETPLISLTDVIQALVDLMDHEDIEIQLCATHGLCNLILSSRIQSASLISRMILKWCNPVSGDEESQGLRQIIGMMLEKLPKLAGSADQIEKSILPTIKTLLAAPKTSPLSEVNIQDIIKFLLALCNICEEATNLHSNLAVSICCEIKDNPAYTFNVVLSKILLLLNLTSDDGHIIRDLLTLCDELRDDVDNRLVLNSVVKFNANLETLMNSQQISVIDEDVEE